MKPKTPLIVLIGITTFLFVVILVMITRLEKLKRQQSLAENLAPLSDADSEVLRRYEAFGKIMTDNGWQVKVLNPIRVPNHPEVQQLTRGSFRATLPDEDGLTVVIGVDAFTFWPEADLPSLTDDPRKLVSKIWPDLHPLNHGLEDVDLTVRALVDQRTLFLFYQYHKDTKLYLFDRFQAFLRSRGAEVERFHAEAQARHKQEQSQFEGIKLIQQTLQSSKIYEGEIDGVHGWRTKRAFQKFLRTQGFYSGDIDGVFGKRTLEGLANFREKLGLSAKPVIDMPLAQAIQKTMTSTTSSSSAANSEANR